MGEFRMPSLGADMEAGTIVEWRVHPGDTVKRGDIIAVVETEKSTIEVEVFETGTVETLLVEPGEEVPVGTPLAVITAAAAPVPAAPAARAEKPRPKPSKRPAEAPKPAAPRARHRPHAPKTFSPLVRKLAEHDHVDLTSVTGSGAAGTVTRTDVEARARHATQPPAELDRVRSSPLARRRAAERGIDLTTVTGSGPAGAVIAADLDRTPTPGVHPAPRATTAAKPPDDRKAKLRASLGALMSRSKREIPHYYLSTEIDLGRALAFLAERNEGRPVGERLLPAALLLRATALAARDVPVLNGHWIDGAFHPGEAVHLGVAISLRGGGLVAPALRDANDLTLDELMARLRDLVTRARAGSLRSSEMTDPTITVTNLGDQGVDAVYGVIYPPQVALVGFGKIVERPWAEHGMLTVRPVVTATLAADHRVSDGHDGARFLAAVDHHLQEPEQL